MASDEEIGHRFRLANDWCVEHQQYRGGWPNFQAAEYEGPWRIVYGHHVLREPYITWQNVPSSEYNAHDMRTRFVGAHDYARRNGYDHGFPNFHEAIEGGIHVYGTFLLPSGTCEWVDALADQDLHLGNGDPSHRPMDEWIRGASAFAHRRHMAAGIPNGNYAKYDDGWHCGVLLIPFGKAEGIDIRGRELGLPDHDDPPSGPLPTGSTMHPGDVLTEYKGVASPDQKTALIVLPNQVKLFSPDHLRPTPTILPNGITRWTTIHEQSRPGDYLVMQGDGNLVLYWLYRGTDGLRHLEAVWNAGTAAPDNHGSRLEVQNDGNLVLYRQDNSVAWQTDTPKIVLHRDLPELHGQLSLVVRPSGQVSFSGYVRNHRVESVDYRLIVQLPAPNGSVAFSLVRDGHMGGKETDNWAEDIHNPAVAKYYSGLHLGATRIIEEKEGAVSGVLTDVGEFLAKFVIGSLAITPGVGVVVLLGASLGSLLTSGSMVAGAQLVNGVLWLSGPYGTLFALAGAGIASIGSNSRELSDGEYEYAKSVFFDTLPPKSKIILTDSIGGDNRPWTFIRHDGKITINMGPDAYDDPTLPQFAGTFIHEMTHVWQVHHSGDLLWIAEGFAAQICHSLGSDVYDVPPPGPIFSSFSLEAQASLVELWFLRGKKETDQYFMYIRDNIRLGHF